MNLDAGKRITFKKIKNCKLFSSIEIKNNKKKKKN